jgi:hypothetical protein
VAQKSCFLLNQGSAKNLPAATFHYANTVFIDIATREMDVWQQ